MKVSEVGGGWTSGPRSSRGNGVKKAEGCTDNWHSTTNSLHGISSPRVETTVYGISGESIASWEPNRGATDGVAVPTDGPAGELGYSTNAYEPGKDGHLHFKVRYNVQDFLPEDVEVTMRGNCLVVHGKKTEDTADGRVHAREFCRTVVVPNKVNKDNIHASLTSDGVLIVDAPLKEPDYSVYRFVDDRKLWIAAKPHGKAPAGTDLAITGKDGAVVMGDAEHRKLHLEVPVDSHLEPKDITIRMNADSVRISGAHAEKHDQSIGTGEVHSSERMIFCKSYALPQIIDAFAATVVLKDHRLVLEAPLMKF